jgi:hypothetical protein
MPLLVRGQRLHGDFPSSESPAELACCSVRLVRGSAAERPHQGSPARPVVASVAGLPTDAAGAANRARAAAPLRWHSLRLAAWWPAGQAPPQPVRPRPELPMPAAGEAEPRPETVKAVLSDESFLSDQVRAVTLEPGLRRETLAVHRTHSPEAPPRARRRFESRREDR